RSANGKRWVKGRCAPAEFRDDKECVAVFLAEVAYPPPVDRARVAEREALNILNHMDDAFMAVDAYGYVIFSNPVADQLANAVEETLFGQNIWEKWPTLKATFIGQEFERVLNVQEPAAFEYCFPQSGRWVDLRLFPAPNREIYAVFREITGRKASEAAQQQQLTEQRPLEYLLVNE
ncbi:MAG: PAS domain-containing protein, partial [Armatimonadota bacterium]